MKKVMFILLGFILGIAGTSYAAYKLKAEQVLFDKTNTNLNSENVQDSIDEIADKLKYGDAEESDIVSGKTALVNGKKILGTFRLPSNIDDFELLQGGSNYGGITNNQPVNMKAVSDFAEGIYVAGVTLNDSTYYPEPLITIDLSEGTYSKIGEIKGPYSGLTSTIHLYKLQNVKKNDVFNLISDSTGMAFANIVVTKK